MFEVILSLNVFLLMAISMDVFAEESVKNNNIQASEIIPLLPNTEFSGTLKDSENYTISERLRLVELRLQLRISLKEDVVEASYIAAIEKEKLGQKYYNSPLPAHHGSKIKNQDLQKKIYTLEAIVAEQDKKISTLLENKKEKSIDKKEKFFKLRYNIVILRRIC